MDDTAPVNQEVTQPSEKDASEKSSVQKRIDELTAEKYAYAKQIEQLTATVTDLIKTKTAEPAPQAADPIASIPEGMDPGVAKWLANQISETAKQSQARTEQLYWQMQHQLDQTQVASKYSNMPPEVVQDAARRFTGLKQRYGDAATMDDAVKLAFAEHALKQMQSGRSVAYNNMSQPLGMQSPMSNVSGQMQQQSTALTPPTQHPDWDRWDNDTQVKAVAVWESKGGRLL